MKEATLVILAAGMGSRYGGLKQLDGMGPNGETLLEYSVYDAIKAGFERVLFIVREAFQEEFNERIIQPLEGRIKADSVCQELDLLPSGFEHLCADREKPWGTGHALWCASEALKEGPFGVINADDFYGRPALATLRHYLSTTNESNWAGLVGYPLGKTLSENGSVSRGIIYQDEMGRLKKVRECTALERVGSDVLGSLDGEEMSFQDDQLVSMNCFGFGPRFLSLLDESMRDFFNLLKDPKKGEFYLPEVLNKLTTGGGAVQVMKADSEWMGVTYSNDKPVVESRLRSFIAEGIYPDKLWS